MNIFKFLQQSKKIADTNTTEKSVGYSNDLLVEHQLCFVHIPKTAGTTFMDILGTIVGRENLLHVSPDILNGYASPDYDINRFACLSGHFTVEIQKLLKKPPRFLTFLREPLARSISNFQEFLRVDLNSPFVQQSPNYYFYLELGEISLEDFINHPHFSDNINNLQTRMLGLSINEPVNSLADLLPVANNNRTVSLELAKERLEKCLFVGIQEEFQMSLDMMAYQFAMFPMKNTPKLNESKQKITTENISDSALNRLYEINHLDIELYEFGMKLFQERYQKMVAAITPINAQEKLSVRELLAQKYWEQSEKIKNIRYNLDVIYPKQGWHPVERINHQQWMWSGPETISTIDLPVDRADPLRIRFQVSYYIELDILESLELHVDGQRIHLIHIKDGNIHIFTGIVPENPSKKYTTTQFSFHVNRTVYPPGMTADTFDARLLGFALNWIEITP